VNRTWIIAAFILAFASGCEELPIESELDSIRPLGVVARAIDPAESSFPPYDPNVALPNEFLPHDLGHLQTVVAGPEGLLAEDRIERAWLACLQSSSEQPIDCLQTGLRSETPPIPCEERDRESGQGDELGQICLIEVAADGTFQYPVLTSQAVGRILIMGSMVGIERPAAECIAALASEDYDLPNDCLYATHELPLGPSDLVLARLESLGIPTDALPPLGDAPPRLRGMNPTVGRVDLRILASDGTEVASLPYPSDESFPVETEQRLAITLEFPPEDAQPYPLAVAGGSYEEQRELLDTRWFATAGGFEEMTEEELQARATWSPGEAEPGDVHMFAVVRDGRFGTAWFHLALRVP